MTKVASKRAYFLLLKLHISSPWLTTLPWLGITWIYPENISAHHSICATELTTGTTLKLAPALNVTRRNEHVACDIVYADVPAIDDGSDIGVIFVGTDIYGIKSDK